MKGGSTHLAHKAEHAVDLDSGAVAAVTLQAADLGDTTTVQETLAEAGLAVAELVEREVEQHPEEEPKVNIDGIEELVADKGYHSGVALEQVKELEVRTYIREKKQAGKRHWKGKQRQQQAVYQNRQRVRGEYGMSLLRRRGEFVERTFAHCYETGGMRRCTLHGRKNILKRLLIHVGAFNISLVLRQMLGAGKPRDLKNRAASLVLRLFESLVSLYRPERARPNPAPVLFPLIRIEVAQLRFGAFQVGKWPVAPQAVSSNTVHLRILMAIRMLIGGRGLTWRGRSGNPLILRLTPRQLRRLRLERTRSSRISSRTAL